MNKQNTEALVKIIEEIDDETKKKIIEFAKKFREEKKDNRLWKPERGKQYFIITSDGTIAPRIATDEYICACFEMGNVFKTVEEAQFEIEKRRVKAELERYALKHNEPNREEWNEHNTHHIIAYDEKDDELFIRYDTLLRNESTTFFTSQEIAVDAIKAVGEDRIKKYLFGVEVEDE